MWTTFRRLAALSRFGLGEVRDLVAEPASGGGGPGHDDGWFRPQHVHVLEDRRVLAVSIVPTANSVNGTEGSPLTITAELEGGVSGQTYTVNVDWGDGNTGSLNVVAGSNGKADVSFMHTYADDGVYSAAPGGGGPIALTVETASAEISATIANVAPTISLSGNDNCNEGALYTLTLGPVTDPGTDTIASYRISWGDGSADTVGVGSPANTTATHTYADDGDYTISVTLIDEDSTHTNAGTKDVTVNNVAPTIALTGNNTVNEGTQYTLTLGAVTEPGADTIASYRIIWGDGSADTVGTGSPANTTATHTYADNGAYTIRVTLIDEDGTHTNAGTKAVTVNNVAPTIALTGNNSVNEGTQYTLTLGAITEPGADTIASYRIVWGDGTTDTVGTGSPANTTATHTYADNGSYTISVTLIDEDGTHTDAGTKAVTVNNVAPTIALTGNNSVNEGTSYTLNLGAVTEPGADTIASYRIIWGDGSADTIGSGSPANTTATHTYVNNGSYTIRVTLIDEDGTHTDAGTKAVTVNNVAPTYPSITINGNTGTVFTIVDGDEVTLVATFFDPGLSDFTNGQTLADVIDWGDSSGREDVVIAAVPGSPGTYTFTATHTYSLLVPSVAQTFNIVLRVNDGTVTATSTAIQIQVGTNNAPVVTITPGGPVTMNEGSRLDLTVNYTDDGPGRTHTVTINWGDGTTPTTTTVNGNNETFNISHVYADNGNYTVTVQVADRLGSTGTDTVAVTVNNVRPTIVLNGALTLNEGSTYTLSLGAITDPGADTVNSYQIHWGDGSSSGVIVGNPANTTATHTYADNGAYTITVELIDEDGTHTGGTRAVTVNNVAPVIAVSGNPSVNEGTPYTLNLGTVTDPGADTIASYRIIWGDGSADTVGSGSPANTTATHTYANNGTFTITVVLIDEDGTHNGAGTLTVRVDNVPPVIDLNSILLPAINEGQNAQLSFSFFDPGLLDTFSVLIDWGDGNGFVAAVGVLTSDGVGNHTFTVSSPAAYTQDALYTVQIQLRDGLPSSIPVTASAVLTVNDVAPVINPLSIVLPPIDEGSVAQLTFSFFDPGLSDTYVITVDFGDGLGPIDVTAMGVLTSDGLGGHTFTITSPSAYVQNGSFTVTMTVTDAVLPTATDTESAILLVSDVLPTLVPGTPSLPSILEGQGASFTFDVFEPGAADSFVVTIDWGDGNPPVAVTGVALGAGRYRFTATSPNAFVQDGTYDVQVRVQDTSPTALPALPTSHTLTVNNVAPTVLAIDVLPGAINEGESATLRVTFTDPGFLDFDPAVPVDVTITWGDGTPQVIRATSITRLAPGIYAFDVVRLYADDAPSNAPSDVNSITMTFSDDHVAAVNTLPTPTVTVNNLPPEIRSPLTPFLVNTTGVGTLSVTFADPGILDTMSVLSIDWGDGGVGTEVMRELLDLGGGVFQLTAQFRYLTDPPPSAPGDPNAVPHFTVQFEVVDKDGGIRTGTIDANVPNGIAQLRPEGPGAPPPLSIPQSVAPTVPAPAPSAFVAVVESEAPTSAQSSVESSAAQVVLREVLPNGREKALGTFEENDLDTVLGKLRGLPDRHYRVYMIMPDGSERLIVDVVVRNGSVADPQTDADQLQRTQRPQNDPQRRTEGGEGQRAEETVGDAPAGEAEQSTGATTIEGEGRQPGSGGDASGADSAAADDPPAGTAPAPGDVTPTLRVPDSVRPREAASVPGSLGGARLR